MKSQIFTNMLLYQIYGLLYLPGVFSWGWWHSPAATLMLAVKMTANCTTWKKEENNLFFMLMVLTILNLNQRKETRK